MEAPPGMRVCYDLHLLIKVKFTSSLTCPFFFLAAVVKFYMQILVNMLIQCKLVHVLAGKIYFKFYCQGK